MESEKLCSVQARLMYPVFSSCLNLVNTSLPNVKFLKPKFYVFLSTVARTLP